jgi:branched-chain amino acid transport system substrate-binding protein
MPSLDREAGDVVLGASIPLSGALAGFGICQQWGYETAVKDMNQAGGISIDGTPRRIRLLIRDDGTNPALTAENTERLIAGGGAVALLGSCTPPLVHAGAAVAERSKIPLVTGCNPLGAFRAARQWAYAWNLFFDEHDLAAVPFRMMVDMGLATNKKVAILTDDGPHESKLAGQLWPAQAASAGCTVVHNVALPEDPRQLEAEISQAQATGADIVLVDAVPPQAIALRRQMVRAGFAPRLLVVEKGGEPEAFAQATGGASDGVLVSGYWHPSFPYPGAIDLGRRFQAETQRTPGAQIANAHAVAQVLLDAIARAGSLDGERINAAIAATDGSYVVGPVKFAADHTAPIALAMTQWHGGRARVVWPADRAEAQLIVGLPTPP